MRVAAPFLLGVSCLGGGLVHAQASGPSAVVDAYVARAAGQSSAAEVSGPQTINVARRQGAVDEPIGTKPVAELSAMLSACSQTNRGYNLGFPGLPKKVVGRYNFECLGPNAVDPSVALVITSSSDGSSVDKVEVWLGGRIYRAGPPPMAPRPKEKQN